MHHYTLPAVIKTAFFVYSACTGYVNGACRSLCAHARTHEHTCKGPRALLLYHDPPYCQSRVFHEACFSAWWASKLRCLSSPQHWGCILLSTKMLGIWSQVCLVSQIRILTSSTPRCKFKNIFYILFNYLCVCVRGEGGGREREAERKEGVSARMLLFFCLHMSTGLNSGCQVYVLGFYPTEPSPWPQI